MEDLRAKANRIMERARKVDRALEAGLITSQEHLEEIELLDRRLDLIEQSLPENVRAMFAAIAGR